MQVSAEHKKGLEWVVSVAVPAKDMQETINKKLNDAARTAKIDGFRPGKIPVKVIEQMYGPGIRAEAVEKKLKDSLRDALAEKKLRPAGMPKFDLKKDGMYGDLEYEASFEIYPEVKLDKLKEIKVTRLKASITDKDVDDAVERLQKSLSDWEVVKHAAKKGDRVTVDYVGDMKEVAEEQRTGKDQQMVLGSGRMIPGFEEEIIGMKVGEEKTIKVKFPKEYPETSLAGKPAKFEITMKQIESPVLPTVDEAFCEKVGIKEGGVEELRKRLHQELENHAKQVSRDKVKVELLDQLLAKHKVTLPKALVEQEETFLHDVRHPHPHDHEHGHTKEEMDDLKKEAERKVALSLLLGEYVRENDLHADEESMLQKAIEVMRRQFGTLSPEMLRYFMQDENQKNLIRSFVLEEKAVDKMLADDVLVTDKPIAFAKLIAAEEA